MFAQAMAASYHNEERGFDVKGATTIKAVNVTGYHLRFLRWMFPEGWVSQLVEKGAIPGTTNPRLYVSPALSLFDGKQRHEALLKLIAMRNYLVTAPAVLSPKE